jgi:hypothetical protein
VRDSLCESLPAWLPIDSGWGSPLSTVLSNIYMSSSALALSGPHNDKRGSSVKSHIVVPSCTGRLRSCPKYVVNPSYLTFVLLIHHKF